MEEVQPLEASRKFWHTAELVAMTFASLDANTLSNCARVNKFISEHALDALYRNDANLWDVLKILGPLRPKRWDNNERLVFTEPLRPNCWARFRHYSSRIRSIIGDTTPNALSQESMLDLITTIPTGESLLPSLSEIYWQNIDETISPLILFILHENVKAMVISVNAGNIVSDYFLENMARKAPAIESFHFWLAGDEPEPDNAINGMIHAVSSLAYLRSLDVHPLLATPDLLRALCSKQYLGSFWGSDFGPEEMDKDALQVIDFDPGIHPDFPRLWDVAICSSLVMEPSAQKMLHAPSLISLHIEVVARDHISEFIPYISSACTQLRHFSMMLIRRHDDDDDANNANNEVNLTMTMLNPLLAMKLIEILVIDVPFPPLMDDHELSQFATAFPQLRHFELCARAQGAPLWKTPTLAALIPFATHCANLNSIGIFMDASIPPPSLPLDGTMFSSTFEVMHVSCSKITDHCWVVDFLMSILPSHAWLNLSRYSPQLRHVGGAKMADIFPVVVDDGLDEDSFEYQKEWEKASKMLDSLKWTRDAMSEQRAEIQRLRTELNAFIE
ncbi:hypothetical protein SISSUDRAFT_1032969 [Sistotremastrum suecicum HHB10207 ss-3]|uniref:F-box domain-containing protein n=1 Tax=Sistotremastrum suecicum HHB10207 ss-3 TaxID=1314776 RepID=A0A166DY02_9AGAM|nr:hypothetical protein SISSUDRAFT_1032969 [Sistotremastrum suecicum HHB10207 ss-3]